MRDAKLRIGVSGLGRGFMLTLPALLRHSQFQLVAAADPRPAARERFAAEFRAKTYSDMASLCADSDVDAVYIASPNEFHAQQAIAAARAGKHVLVEKPMATRIEDCRAMTVAAQAANICLIVGPSHSFDAPVALAAKLIAHGNYGITRMIAALNYTDFLYRPRRPEELNTSRGGGVVYAQAVHQIDVVRLLAASPAQKIRAQTGIWDPARPTEGAYTALMTFRSGCVATLTYSGYGHFDSDELCDWISETGYPKDPIKYGNARRLLATAQGADEGDLKLTRAYGAGGADTPASTAPCHEHFGFIVVSCEHADLRVTPRGVIVYGDEECETFHLSAPAIPRQAVLDELAGAVLHGRQAMHDGEWGTATMSCCLSLLQSSVEGREIAIGG